MRKIRDDFEHSKIEMSVQKVAARNVRDKVADYQKLTNRLLAVEKNFSTAEEENSLLR